MGWPRRGRLDLQVREADLEPLLRAIPLQAVADTTEAFKLGVNYLIYGLTH
jgi:hypothetical protein